MKLAGVQDLGISEVKVIRFARFGDERGYFTETFRRLDFEEHPELPFLRGFAVEQANESYSRAGTIRGLHFQWNPHMGKLVRAITGRLVDVALDIRKGSPTFGRAVAHDLPADSTRGHDEWIWVPPGFAHGICLPEPTTIEYLCTGHYSPGCEVGISPLDPDIDWSLCAPEPKAILDRIVAKGPIISSKDREGLSLTAWRSDPRSEHFVYGKC